jgi:uncharacterized protein YlxW (UPF0749 family)
MFKKIKEFCSFKKENIMTTSTNESASNKRLKKTISEQSEEITRMQKRLNQLVDDVYCMKEDISKFKIAVSNDMQGIVKTFQNQ